MAEELKLPTWDNTKPVSVENMNTLNLGIQQAAPVGSFTWYFGKSAPDGWLVCDGKASLTGHDALKRLLEATYGRQMNTTPDLMGGGLFIRSAKTTGEVITTQKADVGKHNHLFKHRHNTNFVVSTSSAYGGHYVTGKYITSSDLSGYGKAVAPTTSTTTNRRYLKTGPAISNDNIGAGSNSYTGYVGSGETHPANIALLPIIKY